MPSYHGYRFPPDIISHAVWLYHGARSSPRPQESKSSVLSENAFVRICTVMGRS